MTTTADFTVAVRWDADLVGKRLTEEQAHELDAYFRAIEYMGIKLARAKLLAMLAPAEVSSAELVRGGSNRCPECQGVTIFEEGCRKCHQCGWSSC